MGQADARCCMGPCFSANVGGLLAPELLQGSSDGGCSAMKRKSRIIAKTYAELYSLPYTTLPRLVWSVICIRSTVVLMI